MLLDRIKSQGIMGIGNGPIPCCPRQQRRGQGDEHRGGPGQEPGQMLPLTALVGCTARNTGVALDMSRGTACWATPPEPAEALPLTRRPGFTPAHLLGNFGPHNGVGAVVGRSPWARQGASEDCSCAPSPHPPPPPPPLRRTSWT